MRTLRQAICVLHGLAVAAHETLELREPRFQALSAITSCALVSDRAMDVLTGGNGNARVWIENHPTEARMSGLDVKIACSQGWAPGRVDSVGSNGAWPQGLAAGHVDTCHARLQLSFGSRTLCGGGRPGQKLPNFVPMSEMSGHEVRGGTRERQTSGSQLPEGSGRLVPPLQFYLSK